MQDSSAMSVFRRLVTYPRDVLETGRVFLADTWQSVRGAYLAESGLHRGVFLSLLAAGSAIRAWFAVTRTMGYDESVTFLSYASNPFSIALSRYSAPNNHLLNTALVRVSYLLFGISPLAVRLPALLAGIGIIPAAYSLFRALYNKNAALLAMGLVAAASFLIEYSAEGRGYSLVTLCFLVLLILANNLRKRWNTFVSLACAVITALMLYTIPVGVYPAVVIGVWLLLSWWIERPFRITFILVRDSLIAIVLSVFLTVSLYLPVVMRSGLDSLTQNVWVRPKEWDAFVRFSAMWLPDTWQAFNAAIPTWITLGILVAFAVALILNRRISDAKLPVAGVAVIILPILVLAQRVAPYARTWLFLLPLYLGMAAAGIVFGLNRVGRYLSGRVLEGLLLGVPVLAALFLGTAVYLKQSTEFWGYDDAITLGAEQVALIVGKDIHQDDAILTLGIDFPSIKFYIEEHYGLDAGNYVNWTQILRGGVSPQRLFIVLIRTGGQLEGTPEETISTRWLNPADYDIAPQPVLVGDLAIFTANRK
jgi:hypothetical protein